MTAVKDFEITSDVELAKIVAEANSRKEVRRVFLTNSIVLSASFPPIETSIIVEGQGYTIDGNNKYRIFEIIQGRLQINDLTMTGGIPAIQNDWGGAILVHEESIFIVNNSDFIGNNAGDATWGGAIFNNGDAVIIGCRFHDNVAGIAGAILNNSDPMIIRDCVFTDNRSRGKGGAIYNVGDMKIENSTFESNSANYDGGAIFTELGTVQINNSTFKSNSTGERGGAICHSPLDWDDVTCFTTLTHVTIAYNSAEHGGGVFIGQDVKINQRLNHDPKVKTRSSVDLRNSIISGNINGDCFGLLNQNIHNLIEDGSSNPMLACDPMLGNPTGSPATFPLKKGSPAINAAHSDYCLPVDQRNTKRPQSASGDIGACEFVP